MKKQAWSGIRSWLSGLKPVDWAFLGMVLGIMAFYDLKYVAVALQVLFILLTGVEILRRKVPVLQDKPRWLMVLWYAMFFLWAALSYLWADHHSTYLPLLVSLAQVAAIGLAIAYYVDSPGRLRFAMYALVFAAAVFCLRFVLAAPPWVWMQHARIGSILSFGGNRGPVFLSFATLIMVHLALSEKRWWLFVPGAIFLFISMLFGTRTVLVFVFAGAFFIILARAGSWRSLAVQILALAAAGGLVLLLIINVGVLRHTMWRRMDNIGETLERREILSEYDRQMQQAAEQQQAQGQTPTGEGTAPGQEGEDQLPVDVTETPALKPPVRFQASSANTRLDLIDMAVDAFLSAPVLGIGLDNFRFISEPHFTYAHSTQLELLSTLGVIGFLLYYWFHAFLAVRAWKNRRNNPWLIFAFAFLLALFVSDMFLMTYESERDHVMLGIVVAMSCLFGQPSGQAHAKQALIDQAEEV